MDRAVQVHGATRTLHPAPYTLHGSDVPPTLWSVIRRARERFERAGIEQSEAELSAELLAMQALGWDRATLVARWRDPAPVPFAEHYEPLVRRREAREPTAYILGAREFYGRSFEVTRAVLVPRPETEGLVSAAIETATRGMDRPRILDVGTGSGCIAITLALERPDARVMGIESSADALAVAQRNAARLGATGVTFVRGSLVDAVRPSGRTNAAGVDIVLSNPPYVPLPARESLDAEVRFEPPEALFGGDDGLAVIRRLVQQSASVLRPGGWLIFEIGVGQADQIGALADPAAWRIQELRPDLQGIPRVAMLRKGSGLYSC